MKIFKKLAINVHSQVENLADRIENKEALSTAYIREYEQVVAKAKVRLTSVSSDVLRLEKESEQIQGQIQTWTERARRVNAIDETKALECVARIKRLQSNHHQILTNLEEVRELQHNMRRDVETSMEKLEALKRKHQNLASRQVCADAAHALHHTDDTVQDDISDLFSRWETDVVAKELHGSLQGETADSLAEEFEAEEQEEGLRATLQEILDPPQANEEKNNENTK